MNNNFHYYRSELKMKNILRYKTIGIVSELILSKDIFKSNKDIVPFINHIFNVKYKMYVIRSRTMIVARTTRVIYFAEENEYEDFRKRLLAFVTELADINKQSNVKGNHNISFSRWIEGIMDEN